MPRLTPEGYRVFIFRIFDGNLASKLSALHILKSVQMLMDLSMKEDKHKGVFILIDVENITLAYIRIAFKIMRKLLAIETVRIFSVIFDETMFSGLLLVRNINFAR